ncbi:MAG TPA: phospholipid carrier-dependent glycosyltransferase [Solirubrobacteraceae bacterium]|nr:phospholipid carrier-dependent glycosyltransferase [Solirubrobacteraceae bacterium]
MRSITRAAREHRVLTVLLVVGALVRLGTIVAYPPALMFAGDSWAYFRMAWEYTGVGVAAERPSGYPAIIKVLTVGQAAPTFVVALQHLAGLASGVLAYALLRWLDVHKAIALLVAGLLLLDAPTIVLEQHLMPEAFFTFCVLAALALTIRAPRSPVAVGVAGALLALATTTRTVGLFVLPVWAVYLVWRRAGRRAALAGFASAAALLLAYVAYYHHYQGTYGFSAANGWFLYARVGEITECERLELSGLSERICRETERIDGRGAGFFLWDQRSPARRAFAGGVGRTVEERERTNATLGSLARAVIRDRPLAYAGMVAGDFGRFFVPGRGTGSGRSDTAITLPAEPRPLPTDYERTSQERYWPGYDPHVRPPASLLRAYQSVVRTPRPLLAVAALLVLVAVLLSLAGRAGRVPHRREAFLLGAAGLAMLLGAVATSEFVVRYLVPTVPLLLCGGALVAADLLRWSPAAAPARRQRRQTKIGSTSPNLRSL